MGQYVMSQWAPRRPVIKAPQRDPGPEWSEIPHGAPDPNEHLTGGLAQDLAALQAQDTRILQKVHGAHREAFVERYPGQVEHCLRLVMERLQACLDKRGAVTVTDPNTWLLPPVEIADLARAAHYLHQIRQDLK